MIGIKMQKKEQSSKETNASSATDIDVLIQCKSIDDINKIRKKASTGISSII
jgi:hypothetical protein